MKKLFKSGALVLAAAVVMAFASCSNGSSDDEELVYKTIVENKNISFDGGSLTQLVSAATFAKADVKSVKIEFKNYVHGTEEYSWITLADNKNWPDVNFQSELSEFLKTSNSFTYTLSPSELKAYLSGGLYIAGDDGASANITISIGLTADALAALEEAEKLASNTEKTTKITGTTVSFTSDEALQTIFADQLADYNITAMTISAMLYGEATDGYDWSVAITNPAWTKLNWTSSPTIEYFSYELNANSLIIDEAKSSGLWIKANPGLTAEVILTITYTE